MEKAERAEARTVMIALEVVAFALGVSVFLVTLSSVVLTVGAEGAEDRVPPWLPLLVSALWAGFAGALTGRRRIKALLDSTP